MEGKKATTFLVRQNVLKVYGLCTFDVQRVLYVYI